MTHMPGSSWVPDDKQDSYDKPASINEDFEYRQEGKPVKAVIGVAILVVLALILSRMNPAPHDMSNTPAATSGLATGADSR